MVNKDLNCRDMGHLLTRTQVYPFPWHWDYPWCRPRILAQLFGCHCCDMAGHQYQEVHEGRSLACVVVAEVLLHKLETWQMLSCSWFVFYASACANISSKLHCYSLTRRTILIICFSTSQTSCSSQQLRTHDIQTAGSTTINAIVSNQLFEKIPGSHIATA